MAGFAGLHRPVRNSNGRQEGPPRSFLIQRTKKTPAAFRVPREEVAAAEFPPKEYIERRRLLKKYGIHAVIWGCILVATATMTSLAQDAPKAVIRVNGASISSDQVQIWAKAFMEANPGSQITVTGSSAGKGFASFLDRNTDIVIASRVISADEQQRAVAQGMQLGERLIGNSGIAVVTTAKNPVSDLSMTQLRKIFSGEYTNWKEAGGPDAPIRCFTRRVPESGAALFFQEKVLDKQPYGATTTVAESWGTIIKVCSTATDFPIGIAPVIPALAAASSIKIVGVKGDDHASGVKPSDETLKNKTYPIFLTFRYYWDEKTVSDQAKKFVEFCASKGSPSQE